MANDHSISNNPIIQNSGHPFTQLFELLPKLQRDISGNYVSYKTDTNTLKAIYQHAEDATCTLLASIQSLGIVLATAADNKDMGLSLDDVSSIGWLFQSIGDLLGSCHITRDNITEELIRRGIKDF